MKAHLIVNQNLESFLKILDPCDRTTGGGSASAIAGAMAGALAAVVAELSIARKGMEPEAFYEEVSVQGRRLSSALMQGSTEDQQAFATVYDAFRLPRQTSADCVTPNLRARAFTHNTPLCSLSNWTNLSRVGSDRALKIPANSSTSSITATRYISNC